MKMIRTLVWRVSATVHFTLVQADLIPQIVNTLNPQCLSLVEVENIHTCLSHVIRSSLAFSTPSGLSELKVEDGNEQQAVHETVLKQVLMPSEKYLCCLTFIENDESIFYFLTYMIDAQREANKKMEEVLQMWKTVHRTLRMEGYCDMIEQRLRNNQNKFDGRWIVFRSIGWKNLQGMNLPPYL
ncbi:hypothetical protein BLNAU_10758 [Blattamonas nauphoetae]|uniref:Uncharacterized protein n=1 Tax=Blattamonas nauphoetae TaxID=2049346 RepID=A0ABQ9XR22_9EUKA|nr:hypothetical protein BLNAU_10758 [Blattamonas nauphoetae]